MWKCLNNGQVCIAPDYLLVNSAIADRFIEELKSRFADMYGQDERSQLLHEHRSQMVNQHHFERVVGLIQDALERGATLVHGGVWDASSRRIAPTVLDNVTMEMAIMNEEIFGPVLPLIRWNQDEEVNAIVAHNPHPLAMYFFFEKKGCHSSVDASQSRWHHGHQRGGASSRKSQLAFWRDPNQRDGAHGRHRRLQAILQHAFGTQTNKPAQRLALDLSSIHRQKPVVCRNIQRWL